MIKIHELKLEFYAIEKDGKRIWKAIAKNESGSEFDGYGETIKDAVDDMINTHIFEKGSFWTRKP